MEGNVYLHVQLTLGTFAEWMNEWMDGHVNKRGNKGITESTEEQLKKRYPYPLLYHIKCKSYFRESAFADPLSLPIMA